MERFLDDGEDERERERQYEKILILMNIKELENNYSQKQLNCGKYNEPYA
jgi:hypothetical protein